MKRGICRTLLEGLCVYVSNKKKQNGKYLLGRTVYTVVKSKVEISQNFVAFSEYMNFMDGPKYLELSIFLLE